MKAKKVLAMLMASAMILGTTITAFADPLVQEGTGTPSSSDAMNVSSIISGVEAGATITAYQIIDAEYTEDGFVGYKWVAGDLAGNDVQFENDTVVGLTDAYITKVASGSLENLTSANANTQSLGAGTWMLIVTGSNLDKVYNPMIISVYYTTSGSDNAMASDPVSAEDNWSLATNGAYAKSSDIPVTKLADDQDNERAKDNVAVGDDVLFTITTEIPSYSASSNATFIVQDTISNGLSYVLPEGESTIDPTVKIGGVEVEPSVVEDDNTVLHYTVDMTNVGGKSGFKITFDSAYIKTLAGATERRDVEITYHATVTEDAITAVGQNDVTVSYDQGSTTATEYVYSVSFDGIAKKVGVGDDAEGLAGATFTLYDTWSHTDEDTTVDADELSGVVGTYTTTSDYDIEFKGLDADKTYYLTETAAPDGYSINETVYTITFGNLQTDSDGNVTYDVFVNGERETTINYGNPNDEYEFNIVNTKLSNLPSTGGIGTTIFTIGGCVIMVTAAGLYFATRKKEHNA